MARRQKIGTLLTLSALLVSACGPPGTQPIPTANPPPTRILFIGDSLTCWHSGLDVHLQVMAESAETLPALEAASACIGAAPLAEHMKIFV